MDFIYNTQMDITPFLNIINEVYAKDTSRKIKNALRTGKCRAWQPPHPDCNISNIFDISHTLSFLSISHAVAKKSAMSTIK